jgi:outer membrane protein OmpA-like peptidoglycan-associated protein
MSRARGSCRVIVVAACALLGRAPARGAQAAGDRDRDRIEDAHDRCPAEPEVFNGLDDEDGCPDRGGQVIVHRCPIVFEPVAGFAEDASAVSAGQRAQLASMVATLDANPQLTSVGLRGFADRAERARSPRLARARARAVLEALVELGADRRRLRFTDRPAAYDTTKLGPRRVDLVVLERRSR